MTKQVALQEAWQGIADCRNCSIRGSALFAELREQDFDSVHRTIDQELLRAGAVLYRRGDRASSLFTIRRGCVKLLQYLPDGGQRIVRLLRSTDLAGLEAIVEETYHHDAVVMQETEVCRLPVETVRRLAEDNPRMYRELVNRWQRALNDADLWLTELSTGTARERVARLLLRLRRDEEQDGERCRLFSREDMGAMLGITTETASRVVAEFKRKGLVRDVGEDEYVLNTAGLNALIEE